MLEFNITGLDGLDKTLEEAQRALESLDGDLATLHVDPNNPEEAISEMERLVDAKIAPYRGNAIVEPLVEASKEEFKKFIVQEAEEAKRNSIAGEKE